MSPRAVDPLHPGVYAGAGSTGVSRARAFDAAMGVRSTEILDFAAGDNWYNIAGPSWILNAHSGQPARLEYSLPLFPDSGGSLRACAAGSYQQHWTALGGHLVAARLADTVVRPGWEFNGSWYRWSAIGKAADYATCFRNIVTAMRAVSGQRFSFDWNPNIGRTGMPAEQAYPGDDVVDYIGLDVYDMDSGRYAANAPTRAQAEASWDQVLAGDHGLRWWTRFAEQHRKPLALPEWGVTRMASGDGGGDDAAFVDHVFDFIATSPVTVAYEHYFNSGTGQDTHDLTGTGYFPKSAARLRARLDGLAHR